MISGVASGRVWVRMTRMSTWLVIPAILVGLSIGGGAASAAVASAGGHSHEGLGRPVPGVSSIRPRRAQTAPSPCFFTFPDCSSPDPSVAFAMDSSNDTTGCTFQQVTDWGDGDTTTLTYKGGAAGSFSRYSSTRTPLLAPLRSAGPSTSLSRAGPAAAATADWDSRCWHRRRSCASPPR